MLTTHLEQGHTVLTLEEAKDERPVQGDIGGESVTLVCNELACISAISASLPSRRESAFTLPDAFVTVRSYSCARGP